MFQLLLGPFWTLVLLIFKGKTYVVNYGFWFGVFNFSFIIGIMQYFATVYTIYLLIDETYLSPEVPAYEKKIQLYPTLTLIASILFRQVVICIRHGSEQPHEHNAQFRRQNPILANRQEKLLRLLWIEISPKQIDEEIRRQMICVGTDDSEF